MRIFITLNESGIFNFNLNVIIFSFSETSGFACF